MLDFYKSDSLGQKGKIFQKQSSGEIQTLDNIRDLSFISKI